MPNAPAHPCNEPGCGEVTETRYCDGHTKESRRAQDERRAGHNKHYSTIAWKKKRKRWLSKNPFCQWPMPDDQPCNKPASTVDHKKALADGGADDESNYQSLCTPHHSHKTARFDGGFGHARAAT